MGKVRKPPKLMQYFEAGNRGEPRSGGPQSPPGWRGPRSKGGRAGALTFSGAPVGGALGK